MLCSLLAEIKSYEDMYYAALYNSKIQMVNNRGMTNFDSSVIFMNYIVIILNILLSVKHLPKCSTQPPEEPYEYVLLFTGSILLMRKKSSVYFAKVTELESNGTRIPHQSSSRAQTAQHKTFFVCSCFICYFSNIILDSTL